MREVARNWIIQRKIGLLSQEDIVALADDYITRHDEFPDWMIDISTNGSLDREKLLDLMLDPVTDNDCKLIAQQMNDRFISGELDLHKLASACNNLYLLLEWGSAAFNQLVWISDEVDLIDQGYSSPENIESKIKVALDRVIAL
jgi:hypothetical protein